jgi:hypothetical protein
VDAPVVPFDAGQRGSSPASCVGANVAGAHQLVPDQVGDPLCILQVGLVPRHIGQARSVTDDQDESASRQRTPAVRKLSSEMSHRAILFSEAHQMALNLEMFG